MLSEQMVKTPDRKGNARIIGINYKSTALRRGRVRSEWRAGARPAFARQGALGVLENKRFSDQFGLTNSEV